MVVINGSEAPVNFGVNWFYKFYNEASGKDLLTGFNIEGPSQVLDLCINLYFAGYMAASKVDKFAPVLKKQDFEDYVMGLTMAEATDLMKGYTDTIKKTAPSGEDQTQEQEGNP